MSEELVITTTMVRNGLENGAAKVVIANGFGGGIACQIGERAFYFCEDSDDYDSVDEFIESRDGDLDNIAEDISETLNDFIDDDPDTYSDEYGYYYYFLREHGC